MYNSLTKTVTIGRGKNRRSYSKQQIEEMCVNRTFWSEPLRLIGKVMGVPGTSVTELNTIVDGILAKLA